MLDLKSFNLLRPIWRLTQGRLARQSEWRAFVSWQAYYASCLGTDADRAPVQHAGPYVGNSTPQIELIDKMMAAQGAALVSAPPGCGKSRFALELARQIERSHPRWQAVFVRHDEAAVREDLHHLTQLKHVVFIVDDAHECPELVSLLADACAPTSAPTPLHLVCLTRATERARVSGALHAVFPPGMIQQIDLGRPSLQLVRALIDQLLPQSSPHHRDTIARFVRQSYFGAVLVCSVLRREVKLPQTFQRQDLRDRICRQTLRGVADGQSPVETVLRTLAVYAALAPLPKDSPDARQCAAQLSGLTPEAVDSLTARALGVGLFQEDGQALIRPAPDLLGDLLLEAACMDAHGKPTPYGTQLLERLLELEPAATVRNCAELGQLFGSDQDTDLLSKLVLERTQAIPAASQWDALELLQTTLPLAARRPATVIEMARIMEARGIVRRSPPAAELSGTNSVEMRVCALLMAAGEADSAAVPVALGLARRLYTAAREDARSREHVLGLLKTCCRFESGRSVAHAQAVVDALRAAVSEPDVEAAALSAALSAQYLTLEMEGRHDEEHPAGTSRAPLHPVPEIWAVRDGALDTLARGMTHGDATVQCVVVGSLERYAEFRGPPDRIWSDRWSPQLAREMERLSAALIKLAQETTTALPVSAAAERQGWQWWTREQEVLHRAGAAILRAIPNSDAHRLWKSLYAPRLPVRTMLPEPTPTVPQDRLQYVQSLAAAREEDELGQARRLFDTLDLRSADIGAWRALWLRVLDQSPRLPLYHHADVLVGEFARRYPEVAWSFVNPKDADGPFFTMLPFLLVELGKQDRARRSTEARNVPHGSRLEEAWLRALSFTTDFDEPERALLARGLESADSEAVRRAADTLLAAGSADQLTAFRDVFTVIARLPADSGLWDLALQRFVSWAEVVLPPRLGEPTDQMARIADELVALLQAHGSHLRWGFQRHTRQLPNALAIAAVLCPQRLQEWMQEDWGQAETPEGRWSDESPLSVDRLPEIMRLIVDCPAAVHWIETFLGWMRRDSRLAGIGALGLAELCSLDDTRIGELAQTIRAQPTDASQKALADFVNHRKRRERPGSGVGARD
ncbi:MAG TPA: hypothetical protein VFX20_20285 [Steroidobacteraceae bacterium]|nr:hypothetical protein [Steroidobacteraceae bacterium]